MDIKKSAKAGQMVRLLFPMPPLEFKAKGSNRWSYVRFLAGVERMQDHGEGPCADEAICSEVLPNANSAAGGRLAHTDAAK